MQERPSADRDAILARSEPRRFSYDTRQRTQNRTGSGCTPPAALPLVVVEVGALLDGAGGSGELDAVDAVQFALDPRSGLGGGLFGDADQDQGEEAQGDMGPDAV